jgi:hypothetical protein
MDTKPIPATQPRLLTKTDLADRWQTSIRNIDRLVARGRVSKLCLGPRCIRFRLTDIEAVEAVSRTRTIMEGLTGIAA